MAVESPIRHIVGSNRLNPLPHAGTISVFLLIVVVVTGLYLTMFFEFSFEGSYQAVAAMEAHVIQRAVRAIHRYASAALVVTTLVHAWRIFVAQRFASARRFRWVTGVLALVLVWLAGVTGYWMIWDVRAQILNESVASLVAAFSPAAEVAMLVPSGSGVASAIVMWTVHLLLTGVIAWALWRHLRKTRHPWMPPPRWSALMGAALVVAAVAFPVGMLPAWDPSTTPGAVPLDPFVMFLLPLLRSGSAWLTLAVSLIVAVVASVLPWILRREEPPLAVVIEEACTGCELCVIDCPYLALSMSGEGDDAVAVLDAERCVGCGICLGSCSFGAIAGFPEFLPADPVAGAVTLACTRQVRLGGAPSGLIEVRCTGELNPRVLTSLSEAGAESVQVVGCAPGECVYGTGNLVTSERLTRTRAPFLPRAWDQAVAQDWVPPGDLADAVAAPGAHPEADITSAPPGWVRLFPVGMVVLVSVIAVGWATDTPFGGPDTSPIVRVAVDHRDGAILEAGIEPTGGDPALVEIDVDGEVSHFEVSGDERRSGVIDLVLPPGPSTVEVRFVEGDDVTVLFDDRVDLDTGDRLLVTAFDRSPDPDEVLGREIFFDARQGGCDVCHSLEPDENRVGPSLAGIADVAGSRVPGLSAEEYLRQSIVDPDAYVVDGYRAGQMLAIYEDRLDEAQIDALVAFLMSGGR